MKIASGTAPVAEMRKHGLNVGIGIDSCAVSDNTDFFEAMRTMIFLQRVTSMNPRTLLGKDALKMATIEGARSIGKGHEIGSLEKGKKADIILVNLTDVNTRPYNELVNNLVFAANSANIDTVIIGGEMLVHEGVFTKFDKESILDEVETRAAEIYRNAGVDLPPYFSINDL
jgi:5-methylthioadenosine/S-adenosylhomocysteine deaminase